MSKAWAAFTGWLGANKPLWICGALIVAADRASKVWALAYLQGRDVDIFPYFRLHYVENTGMAFGLMQDGNLPLIGIMLAVLAYLAYSWKELAASGVAVKWGAAFIFAGALGNLYDRIRLGFVVDFLDFRVWPVFNVADSFITIGGILLALSLLPPVKKGSREEK